MPLVSVVIPCHDLGAYLGDAVASALAQTERDLEVVVVDDGSREDLSPALRPCEHDARLRRLRLEARRGPAAARNAGIQSSDSEFVGFLDADDQWLPRKLAAQLAALRASPWAACTDGVFVIRESRAHALGRAWLNGAPDLYQLLLSRNAFGNPSAVLVRRSSLAAAGGFDETLAGHEDHDLWARLARAERLGATRGALTLVRRDRPDSRIRSYARMSLASAQFLEKRARDEPPPSRQELERARVVHALRNAHIAARSEAPDVVRRCALRAVALSLRPVSFGHRLAPALCLLAEALRSRPAAGRRTPA